MHLLFVKQAAHLTSFGNSIKAKSGLLSFLNPELQHDDLMPLFSIHLSVIQASLQWLLSHQIRKQYSYSEQPDLLHLLVNCL